MQHILNNSSNIQNKCESESNNLVLKPPSILSSLFNQFDNTSQAHDHKDPENLFIYLHSLKFIKQYIV